MSAPEAIQGWLRDRDLDAVIIPSTDDYLNEFTPPPHRELGWATGFTGSTGVAVILRDNAVLFLDGRYSLQGIRQTQGFGVTVCSTAIAARQAWLATHLQGGSRVAIDPRKHSSADLQTWDDLASNAGFVLVKLASSPAESLWHDRPAPYRPMIVDYPLDYAGDAHESKCEALRAHLVAAGQAALLVADPEDVSWLLNVRAEESALQTAVGDWHIVPSALSRVLVPAEGPILWFVDEELLSPTVRARTELVRILPPETLADVLRRAAGEGPVGADVARTPAAFIDLIREAGRVVPDSIVSRRRWRKHPREIEGAKRAHLEDAAAVVTFMAWLSRSVTERRISELDAAHQLEAFRRQRSAYRGPSMPLMSASGASASMPHYVPSQDTVRWLNDHPVYWMDSGGQYLGGTTDNTISLALGEPEPKHVAAHTVVLKAYIALATAKFPVGVYGFALEVCARQKLWELGLDYATGTGHGVGNYLNIHEGPYLSREPSAMTTVPIEADMIITNEPGLYEKDDFGIRIESHMVSRHWTVPGFLEFETISRFPIDPRLIDFSRLTDKERTWLARYHLQVVEDIAPLVDEVAGAWLRELVSAYASQAAVQPVAA